MKKLILALLTCVLISGCQEQTENNQEWSYINISCEFIETKADLGSVKKLHYYFFNTVSGECIEKTQLSTNLNFGTLTDTLKIGTYDCIVVGHSGETQEAEKEQLSFSKVTETFRGIESFELERGKELKANVVMDRINSRVEIVAKEKLPAESKSIELKLTNVSSSIDLMCGESKSSETIERTYELRDADAGKENLTFGINCFPCEEKESVLTITTHNKKGEVLRHIETDPFQLERNKISRFTGYLFITFGIPGVGLTLNQEWEDPDEYELPD